MVLAAQISINFGQGGVGKTKEDREGVLFLGLPAAGTHRGGRIWPEKGAAEIVLQLRREAVVQRQEGSEEGPGRCNSARGDLNLANINTRHFYLMQLKYEELHGMSWEIDNIAIECKTL